MLFNQPLQTVISQAQPGISNGIFVSGIFYITSTLNSTSVQLPAGGVFIGGVESIFNQPQAQIEIISDQPYALYTNEYIDAAGSQLTRTLTYYGGSGTPFCETITLPGNYFNIKIANSGPGATTILNVNTTYGQLPNDVGSRADQMATDITSRWSMSSLSRAMVGGIPGGIKTYFGTTGAGLNTVVKTGAGRVCKIMVLAPSNGISFTIYDNASANTGSLLFISPASGSVGQIYDLQLPVTNGIVITNPQNGPIFNMSYV